MKKQTLHTLGLQGLMPLVLIIISCLPNPNETQKNIAQGWRILTGGKSLNGVNAISIADETSWWIAKDNHLLYSKNSGDTWETIYELPKVEMSGLKGSNRVEKIQFLNKKDGWLLGVTLFATEDGGKSWKEIYIDNDSNDNAVPVLRSFYFIDKNRGWVAGNILKGGGDISLATIWETFDGGKHWRRITCSECIEREVFGDLTATREGEVWVVGDLIYRKMPGSYQLQEVKIDLNEATSQLIRVGVAEPNLVWAEVADGKSYFISYDLGKTWAVIIRNKASDRLIFINSRQAYLVSNGEVHFSEDGGRSWRVEISGDYKDLYLDNHREIIVAIGQQLAIKHIGK